MREYLTIFKGNTSVADAKICANFDNVQFYDKDLPHYFILFNRVRRNQPSTKALVLWDGDICDERKGSWIKYENKYVIGVDQPVWYR